jgi:shikimate dehydrogenase
MAGVTELAIFDVDTTRQQQLAEHLNALGQGKVIAHTRSFRFRYCC